jgi:ubiquinone/menaquinone biosynthesis C-methylase UbiE
MLAVEGVPIEWIEGSALTLPFPAGKFDLVLCQLGLQFFPDQGRATQGEKFGTGRRRL